MSNCCSHETLLGGRMCGFNRHGAVNYEQKSRVGKTSAIDFGQLFFFEFGQFDFGQSRVWPISVAPKGGGAEGWWARRVVGPKGGGPEGWRQPRKSGAPKGGGPKFRAFFPLPPQFSFFSPSLGGPSVEFWWCLKRRDREMCTFGVLGLSCETPSKFNERTPKRWREE